MLVHLESTTKIVEVNGVPARLWEGHTANGIAVHALITRIAVNKENDTAEFERDLQQCKAPSPEFSIPLRLIL